MELLLGLIVLAVGGWAVAKYVFDVDLIEYIKDNTPKGDVTNEKPPVDGNEGDSNAFDNQDADRTNPFDTEK